MTDSRAQTKPPTKRQQEVFSEPGERARKAKETKDRYDFTCLTVEEVARSYQVRFFVCVFFIFLRGGYIYMYINI